jgi:hypothetical protein
MEYYPLFLTNCGNTVFIVALITVITIITITQANAVFLFKPAQLRADAEAPDKQRHYDYRRGRERHYQKRLA